MVLNVAALSVGCLRGVDAMRLAAPGRRLDDRRPDPTLRCLTRSPAENGDMHVAAKARDLGAASRFLRVCSYPTVRSADR